MISWIDEETGETKTKETIADRELAEYDEVIVVQTSVGIVPVYKFIEKFLKIEDKDGNIIPFELNVDQVDLYKEMCKQKLRGEPIRIDILKARQLGFSTFIAAVIFTLTIFVPNQKAAIVADLAEHASNLFAKYITFYDNLPKELKLPLVKSNAKELVVLHDKKRKSSIRITVQGEGAGRSGTYQYLHLSECAFWDDLKKTLVSLLQTVSMKNINSMVFLETTGNGFNEYKTRWDNDVAGSDYVPLFYGWYSNPDYTAPYRGFKLLEWEEKLMAECNLSLEQIAWYHSQWLAMDQDLDDLKQEYPSTPIEAFKTTGNSVFNMDLVQKRKDEVLKTIKEKPYKRGRFTYKVEFTPDGSHIDMSEVEWLDSRQGEILIITEPDSSHPYVVNCDPAMGGEDYYAIQVLDNYTGEQVAVYHQNKVDDDEVGYQLVCLGHLYNDALICSETNTTAYLLNLAEKCGYPLIYQDKDFEDLTDRYANKYGYKTKQNNRQVMISMFKEAFRDNYKMISDYATLCEMEEFQIIKSSSSNKEKAQAISGKHDDLVMAMCGVFLIRNEQSFLPVKKKSLIENKNFSPFKRNEQNKMMNDSEVYQRW